MSKVKPEQVRVKPEQVKVKPEQVKAKPEQVRVKPEQVRVKPEQVRAKPEQVKAKPEQVRAKPEQVRVKPEQVRVKSDQVKPKPESPRLKKESLKTPHDAVKSKSEHPASLVKVRKDVLHQDSLKPVTSELLSSPVKSRKDVLQSPGKMKKRVLTKPVMQEASTLDLSSIGIGNLLTTHEPTREQHREKHRTPDVLSPPKVKREHSTPVVKKETAVKLDFNYPKSVLQKGKSEPVMKPVAPPKKRIKNMMQTQSQPLHFDAQYLGEPQQVAPQHIPKPAPQQINPYHMQSTLQQKPQPPVREVQQPAWQPKPQPPVQPQPVQQQVPQPMATFSNPVVESWSDMMHPAEILDASDFLNDMKHDMSQLDDLSLSTGLLPDNLFDFQETESRNPVKMNVSSEVLAQQAMILPLTTIEPSPSAKKKSVQRVSSEVKHTEHKVIHKEVHPAEVLDEIVLAPVKKSKPVKKDLERLATNQLEFEPHPAELFETKSAPAQDSPKSKEPSEDGELAGDESLVHPTEIENPALLRVKNEEPIIQKDRSSDQERRSDHRHSEHKRHSKHKHSSEKKKKDKDKDRHRSKDRSSSRSRDVHSSESRENSNGNGAGPSDEQPTSVLTTSGGIKLKIKLGNSFSEKQSSPSAGSSPLSMKIDLKKIQSSKRDYDGKERRKDKSKSHKHKSHKRSHSPLETSIGDAPASPAKRRATNSSHNSLLSLPMPPADPKKKSKHSLNNSNGESPASNVYNFN